ncbi:MAG: hypothetical protein ACQEXX_01410 [Bacillota bacterium]
MKPVVMLMKIFKTDLKVNMRLMSARGLLKRVDKIHILTRKGMIKMCAKEGYNNDLFEITCLKCGSNNCNIQEHELFDEEDESLGESWYVFCTACGNCDI